jgi:hypothetical protein
MSESDSCPYCGSQDCEPHMIYETVHKGQARPKYEAPHREHPDTVQDVMSSAIHANHLEVSNASFRRRNPAYRRRTNTYAKSTSGLILCYKQIY